MNGRYALAVEVKDISLLALIPLKDGSLIYGGEP